MFGYIKVDKPDLKIREFDAYKAVYCTVCRQLRRDYGPLARFTLSYDYTFFAMLRLAALACPVQVVKGRCPYNPLAKCRNITCQNEELSYAAGVAMIMFYYKLRDTLHDEGFWKRLRARLIQPFAARWHRKAARRFADAEAIVAGFCRQQETLEKQGGEGLDRYAHPTADALAQLLCWQAPNEATGRVLQTVGYHVGKWVYLADALDDFATDVKKGRFNPLAARLGPRVSAEELVSFTVTQMNYCIDQACLAFELLPKGNFNSILENILFQGLLQQQNEISRRVVDHE